MSEHPRRLGWMCAAIAVGAALIVALASFAVATVEDCGGAVESECDRVFADFTWAGLETTNDGTPLSVHDNGLNASGLQAVDGELTHGAPIGLHAAGYLEARMPAPVARIGAVAEFHADTSGAIGLASFADSVVAARDNEPPDPIPDSGILFAANNMAWHFSVWDSAAEKEHVLLHGLLALSADGSGHAFEVARYGDTVVIRLPDGTVHAATDPRIAEWSGPWAAWQLYEYDPTQVPATITSIWAS